MLSFRLKKKSAKPQRLDLESKSVQEDGDSSNASGSRSGASNTAPTPELVSEVQDLEPADPVIRPPTRMNQVSMSYEEDVASRPPPPDAAAYEELSVEEFGQALLRGFSGSAGTKENDPYVNIRPRDELAGVGATSHQQSPAEPRPSEVPVDELPPRKRPRSEK